MQSTKQYLQQTKTQAMMLAKAAQQMAVRTKELHQATAKRDSKGSKKQLKACNVTNSE